MIAYLRYTMWDPSSYEIYELLDAEDYHGGVSGTGTSSDFTHLQVEKARSTYIKDQGIASGHNKDEFPKLNEILEFLAGCLKITEKEQTVEIYFG